MDCLYFNHHRARFYLVTLSNEKGERQSRKSRDARGELKLFQILKGSIYKKTQEPMC